MGKRSTAVAVMLAVLALASCSSTSKTVAASDGKTKSSAVSGTTDAASKTTTTVKAKRQPLQVKDYGFTQLPPDSIGSSYVSYAVELVNPNANEIAESVSLNIAFKNAAGAVVSVETPDVSYVMPGGVIAATASSLQASGVTSMTVQALVNRWEKLKSSPGTFTTSGVTTTVGDYSLGLKTVGSVHSTFAQDLKQLEVVAVYRDGGGKITGGQFDYIDFVPTAGDAAFEIDAGEVVAHDSTSVSVNLTSLTALGAG